ncbi:MAG: di-trans,poly-cis-decaprenylcistransferase [Clostridia bacterium]|nr:di-trans,poly-cis-decaprenylcistransferase [Clostridia bacterium]
MAKNNTDINENIDTAGIESVGIIMDGNGRWAKKRLLPRTAGHVAGAANVQKVLEIFRSIGVHHVTLYAFSTENWKRPREEVEAIMELVYKYLDEVVIKKIETDKNFSMRFLGDKSVLSEKLRNKCIEVEEMAKDREFVCNVALNYGGRDEIVHAANEAIKAGLVPLTEEALSKYMYTSHSPDPDLIIRTGGDFRVSNFLLWQGAYSEYVIFDTLWPDFGKREILEAINQFKKRDRRYGGIGKNE